MGLFDNWPYSDVHQLNLDWILKVVKDVKDKTDEIDAAVETAQQAAEDASQSEINAADAKDDAVLAAGNAQNFYNQILYLTGSAVVANTAAAMTDTDKVYIYVGSEFGYETNHWYYYDGNNWVDGGEYGAGGGISNNARNLLKYILDRVVYIIPDMETYVEALYEALAPVDYQPLEFTITNALVNVYNDNDASTINGGSPYTANLTAIIPYTITSVVITMGGVDVTNSVYSAGVINIPSVTGNIVITATASEVWDIEWNYTMGSPLDNGWLAANAAGTMVADGYRMTPVSNQSCGLNYDPDITYSKAEVELKFTINRMASAYQGFYISSPGIRLRIYSNKLLFNASATNTEAAQTVIDNTMTTDVEYTLRFEYDTSSYANVYLNNVPIYSFTGALDAGTTRLLISATHHAGTTSIINLHSIRVREVL